MKHQPSFTLPLGPCSVCWGGTNALQPALEHRTCCKTGAGPETGAHGVFGDCCPPPRQLHQGSPAARRGSPCSKPHGLLHPSRGPRCDKPLGCSSQGRLGFSAASLAVGKGSPPCSFPFLSCQEEQIPEEFRLGAFLQVHTQRGQERG